MERANLMSGSGAYWERCKESSEYAIKKYAALATYHDRHELLLESFLHASRPSDAL